MHDPYRPPALRGRPAPRQAGPGPAEFPETVFLAAGAGPRAMIGLYRWWDELPEEQRQATVNQLQVTDAGQVAAILTDLETLAGGSSDETKEWVERSPDTAGAARLALAFEQTRAAPQRVRPGLRAWLEERSR